MLAQQERRAEIFAPESPGLCSLEFLKTTALAIPARFERYRIAVRALALGGLHAPEIDQAGLVVRVALEVLTIDGHRFAAQVHAARFVIRWVLGHGWLPEAEMPNDQIPNDQRMPNDQR